MPLYDFRCLSCGVVEERLVERKIKSRACECGGMMERLFPKANVIYLGLGFYTTENRKSIGVDEHGLPKRW